MITECSECGASIDKDDYGHCSYCGANNRVSDCPNCGSSIDDVNIGVCLYCGSRVIYNNSNFVIDEIECINKRKVIGE